jgi:hypothetical protein
MMRQKIFLFLVLLLLLLTGSYAQDKGFTFLLGPSVNYYGDMEEKFSYSTENLNWQFNGQLGYISTRGGTTRGNMLAIFGTGGNTNPGVLQQMQTGGANIMGTINTEKNFNEFYTLEGGMVIARFLRISGGIGNQYYSYQLDGNENNGNGNTNSEIKQGKLNYFSGTLGIVFDLGVVNWVVDANLMTGKDLNQKALKISTGFMVKF